MPSKNFASCCVSSPGPEKPSCPTHLSDLIPEIQRVILIRQGRIVDDGSTRRTLTSAKLSQLFRTPFRVTRAAKGFNSLSDR